MNTQSPVDAVITWVDGYDPAHQHKLSEYLASLGIDRPPSAEPTRFNQCGEIEFCVRSILRFVPWISTIYIITDAQTPSIISQLKNTPYETRVKIIDHRVIFRGYETYLPTFNSMTIESMMWRIPDLAERFIYFNDDCFLLRPLAYTDFFRDNKLVLRGDWRIQTAYKWRNRLQNLLDRLLKQSPSALVRDEYRALQEDCAQRVGMYTHFFHLPHVPFPLHKSWMADFFNANPDNLRHRLRHPEQILPVSMVIHLAIKQHQVVFDNTFNAISINPAFHSFSKIHARLTQAARNQHIAFMCLQSLDMADKVTCDMLLRWLDKWNEDNDNCNSSNGR